MGKREEALDLLNRDLSPKEIANIQGVSLKTILGYLNELIGRGVIRRSDILFSVPKDIRSAIALHNYIEISLESESSREHLEKLKQVIENGYCADETARFRLLQAGLIKGSGDVYACRCDLYRMYFKDKL